MNASNQLEKSTYYVLDAQGKKAALLKTESLSGKTGSSKEMSVYEHANDDANQVITYAQTEKHIYGASRLGINNEKTPMFQSQNKTYSMKLVTHRTGERVYELSNHLGNVLSVISDKIIPHQNGTTVDYFLADIRQSTDYSPFGVTLQGRNYIASGVDGFRYGYQGSEMDNEVKNGGNSYTTFFRQLDPRLGRWLSLDPKISSMPWQSPYCSMDNKPIWLNDPLGDSIRLTDAFKADKTWMKAYNRFLKSDQGKQFKKDFDKGGQYEHIAIVFDLKDLNGIGGQTRTEYVNKETKEPQSLHGLEILGRVALAKGTEVNNYLRFTISMNQNNIAPDDKYSRDAEEVSDGADILHETQHVRINLSDLYSGKQNLKTEREQHDLMRDKTQSYYWDRNKYWWQNKYFWYHDFLKQ
jgi:RHS repeat-associated protein